VRIAIRFRSRRHESDCERTNPRHRSRVHHWMEQPPRDRLLIPFLPADPFRRGILTSLRLRRSQPVLERSCCFPK
jgi:hypothetical protein